MAADMCLFCPHKTISAVPAPSLQDEVTVLRKELEREQQKNIELEGICRDLNQDNDQYLGMALQLERAVEKLLVALSLPTTALYRTGVTNYQALLNLIDDETPRLRALIAGLDMLASLALGLNSSIKMHQGEIRSLQEDVSRLEGKKWGTKYGDAILQRRPHSSSKISRNEERHTATCVDDFDEFTTADMKRNSVSVAEEGSPLMVPVPSNRTLSETDQGSYILKEPDMGWDTQRIKSVFAKATDGPQRALRTSSQAEPAAFNIFDGITDPNTLSRGYKCAISIDGQRLAGDPFCYQAGWQIHFTSYGGTSNPHIALIFRLTRTKFGTPGNVQAVKGFELVWQLSLEDSFKIREVKAYQPVSLRHLPLSLTMLCANKHVRGTLWLISLVGMFDSPPDYSRRVLKDLDEDMKVNLRALFAPGSAKQVHMWFVNPKDDDRQKRKLDMDALIGLRSLH